MRIGAGGITAAIVLRHTAFGTRDTSWDGDGIYHLAAPKGSDTRWIVASLRPGPMVECR